MAAGGIQAGTSPGSPERPGWHQGNAVRAEDTAASPVLSPLMCLGGLTQLPPWDSESLVTAWRSQLVAYIDEGP